MSRLLDGFLLPVDRRFILAILAVLAIVGLQAASSSAAEGEIELSVLPFSGACTLVDNAPALRTIYVLHSFNPGATASRFRIANGPGATMTYVSEAHAWSNTSGDTQSGITICYGACVGNEFVLATVTYMAYGTSAFCSRLLVAPHPQAQTVEAINCSLTPVATYVQDLDINTGTSSCGCPLPHVFPGIAQQFGCNPLETMPTTWGSIKALYR
jgi:hypothetical protein